MNAIRRSFILLFIGLTTACARGGAGEPGLEHVVLVQIENDLTRRGDVSVRILASAGASTLLGGAGPGQTRTFDYSDPLLSGSYRLQATTGDGRTIESRPFTLFPGAAVLWQLQRNLLQVVRSDLLDDAGG